MGPTATDDKATAAEGAWAYHIVKHQQSFASADCVSAQGLFQTMFSDSVVAKKFGCAQRKTVKIITGVLAPYSTKCLLSNLESQPFSVSTDASNHKAIKLFSLPIRYFNPKQDVRILLLDMRALPGESSEMVLNFIESALKENDLDLNSLVSFCADNAPLNFGGTSHGGQNNVFARLKEKVSYLIPIGCPAHILHNSAKKGADQLPLDIETIVFKLESYFKESTSRHGKFKDFCDYVELEYSSLPTHTPTRWTTLAVVLSKTLMLWDALELQFSPVSDGLGYLKTSFHRLNQRLSCASSTVRFPAFSN